MFANDFQNKIATFDERKSDRIKELLILLNAAKNYVVASCFLNIKTTNK